MNPLLGELRRRWRSTRHLVSHSQHVVDAEPATSKRCVHSCAVGPWADVSASALDRGSRRGSRARSCSSDSATGPPSTSGFGPLTTTALDMRSEPFWMRTGRAFSGVAPPWSGGTTGRARGKGVKRQAGVSSWSAARTVSVAARALLGTGSATACGVATDVFAGGVGFLTAKYFRLSTLDDYRDGHAFGTAVSDERSGPERCTT